jgi:chemotaxis protein CheD
MIDTAVHVKMADMRVVTPGAGEGAILKTTLGSCIGVILSDKESGIHGLAHIMLPKRIKNDSVIGKYADTAIPALVDGMEKKGSSRKRMKAYLVGGACMFNTDNGSAISQIGNHNIRASKEILESLNVELVFEKTGGNSGMTVIFDGDTGKITVRTLKKMELK